MKGGLLAIQVLLAGCQPASGPTGSANAGSANAGSAKAGGAKVNGAKPGLLLRATPARTDLGTVKPGSRHEVKVAITNPGPAPVAISRWEYSCDCLKLELPKQTWQPGETVIGKLVVDLSKEPEFQGASRLSVEGRTATGELGLKVECEIEVQRAVPARSSEMPQPFESQGAKR